MVSLKAVTPAGLAPPTHNEAYRSNSSNVRNGITSVLNASIILGGLIAIEALFNFLNHNILGGLVALTLAFIPACGWYGALRKKRSLLRVFYISNAAGALCFIAGVSVLAGIMIPSLQCACDPTCSSLASSLQPPIGGDAVRMDPLGDVDHMQFYGIGEEDDMIDRTENGVDNTGAAAATMKSASAGVLLDAAAQYEYSALCSRIAFIKVYINAALSLLGAAVHAYGFVVGRRLHKATVEQSHGDGAGDASKRCSTMPPSSGPRSAPGSLRRHIAAGVAQGAPVRGLRHGGAMSPGLYLRQPSGTSTGDVEAQGRGGVASPFVVRGNGGGIIGGSGTGLVTDATTTNWGPMSSSSVKSSSAADRLC